MFSLQGYAYGRDTDIGGLVETFIESNKNAFSIEQLQLLESLGHEVDMAAIVLENEIDNLKDDVEKASGEIEALQDQRDELETQVKDLEDELEELKNDE